VCSGFTGLDAGVAGREIERGAAHGHEREHIYTRSVLLRLLFSQRRTTATTTTAAAATTATTTAATYEGEGEDYRGSTRGRDPLPTSGRLVLHPSRPVASSILFFVLSLSPPPFLSLTLFLLCLSHSLSLTLSVFPLPLLVVRTKRKTATVAAFSCRP